MPRLMQKTVFELLSPCESEADLVSHDHSGVRPYALDF